MEKKELLSDIVAAQLKSLMLQADLTIEGLSEAAGLSTHTITKILKGQTRLSPTTVDKLTGLFGISASALMSSVPIELDKQEQSASLGNFFESNEANLKYFLSRAKDNVVAHFIKTVLMNDSFLNEGRRVREITEYIRTHPPYQKNFNPKVIAKVLDRLVKAGKLQKEDRTGKGSVYYYRR